jgi:hypothetical protein
MTGLRSLAESQLQMQTARSAALVRSNAQALARVVLLFNGALTFLVLAIVIELAGGLQ